MSFGRFIFGLFLAGMIIPMAGCAPFHWGTTPDSDAPEAPRASADVDRDNKELASVAKDKSPENLKPVGPKGMPDLSWPLPKRYVMRDGFNATKTKTSRKHLGIDFPAPRSTPIFAAHAGWVTYTGRKFHGYGRMVIIDNGKGWQTLYAHMNKIKAKQGKFVHQGDTIGEVGATGHAHGTHLHFELMQANIPIDPAQYLSTGSRKLATQN